MDFTFYSRAEYFKQLVREISNAGPGDRVAVATMTLNSAQPLVHDILHALQGAANRGAEVTLLVDAYIFLNGTNKLPGPLWYKSVLSDRCSGRNLFA